MVVEYKTMTVLMRCENGWLHFFMFTGTEGETGFTEFEELVRSAEYPPAMPIWSFALIGSAAVLAICLFPAAIYRFVLRRRAVPRRKAMKAALTCGISVTLLTLLAVLLFFGVSLAPACGGVLGGAGMYFVLVSGSEPEPEHL